MHVSVFLLGQRRAWRTMGAGHPKRPGSAWDAGALEDHAGLWVTLFPAADGGTLWGEALVTSDLGAR